MDLNPSVTNQSGSGLTSTNLASSSRRVFSDLALIREQLSLQERIERLATRSNQYRTALPNIKTALAPENFAGMERKYVEQIRLTMKRLFSWFPEVAQDLSFVGTPTGARTAPINKTQQSAIRLHSAFSDEGVVAFNLGPTGTGGSSIVINPRDRYNTPFGSILRDFNLASSAGRVSGNLGATSVAVHEFGHTVDRVRSKDLNEEFFSENLTKRDPGLVEELLDRSVETISSYAATNPQELFAESFTQSLTGTPSGLGRAIYSVMNESLSNPSRRRAVLAAEANKFSGLTGIQSGWSEAIDLRREALGRILSPTAQAIRAAMSRP